MQTPVLSVFTAQDVLTALAAAGVRDVVLCPGSRNASLVLAAAAQPQLRLHTRLDERTAAFLALGLARASRRPAAVCMTSGTAVAHALPALIEAHYSGVPLIVLAADRPARLHGVGASQTIDQATLAAPFASCVNVPAPGEQLRAGAAAFGALDAPAQQDLAAKIRQWRRQQQDALLELVAAHPRLQLNIELDTPLVPAAGQAELEALLNAPEFQPAATADLDVVAPLPELLQVAGCAEQQAAPKEIAASVEVDLSRNTLVIAGDGAWEVPGLEEVPTIAEPVAPAPYLPVHPLAAAIFNTEQVGTTAQGVDYVVRTRPEQIIVVGRPTLDRQVLKLLAPAGDETPRLVVLSQDESFANPFRRTDVEFARGLKLSGAPSPQWLRLCEAANEVAVQAVRAGLEDPEFGFTGLHVAAALGDMLAVGDSLVVGASNPVRDMSLVGLPFDGVSTYSPRGAAGIDGMCSQAIGTALAVQAAHPAELQVPRTWALVGDVTALHDLTGLVIPAGSPRPQQLTIVVANDDGGAIFENLEQGAPGYREAADPAALSPFEQLFAMPHGVELAGVCASAGVAHCSVDSLPELQEVLVARAEGRLIELKSGAQQIPAVDPADFEPTEPGSSAGSYQYPGGIHPIQAGLLIIEARTTRTTRRALAAQLAAAVRMSNWGGA